MERAGNWYGFWTTADAADPKRHWNHELAGALSNPRFAFDHAATPANFGFETLKTDLMFSKGPSPATRCHSRSCAVTDGATSLSTSSTSPALRPAKKGAWRPSTTGLGRSC